MESTNEGLASGSQPPAPPNSSINPLVIQRGRAPAQGRSGSEFRASRSVAEFIREMADGLHVTIVIGRRSILEDGLAAGATASGPLDHAASPSILPDQSRRGSGCSGNS